MPALLLVAAGLSEVDARAGALWPRIARWTSCRKSRGAGPLAPDARTIPCNDAAGAELESSKESGSPSDGTDGSWLFLTERRRAAYYASKRSRRERRRRRRQRLREALAPPGPLSYSFRLFLGLLSLALLVGTGLPYLSLNLQDSALGSTTSDPEHSLALANLAARLQPGDPEPFQVKAYVYQRAAREAATSASADRSGAVLDDLALAVASWEECVRHEPAEWTLRYNASVAVLNLIFASDALTGRDVVQPESTVIGLDDWSTLIPGLGSAAAAPAASGQAAGSLADTTEAVDTASRYRQLSREDLLALADKFLAEAHDRYPLSGQVKAADSFLQSLISRSQ